MNPEIVEKLLVYCNNLDADDRAALVVGLARTAAETKRRAEDNASRDELIARLQRRLATLPMHTLNRVYTFMRQSPVKVQITFTKEELHKVVSYCEQTYTEPDGRLSLRFPVEPPGEAR